MREHGGDVRAAGDRLDGQHALALRAGRAGAGSVRCTTAWVKQTSPTMRSAGSTATRVHHEPSVIRPRQRSSSRPGGGGSQPAGAQARYVSSHAATSAAMPGTSPLDGRAHGQVGGQRHPASSATYLQLRAALLERPGHRRDDQRPDARVAEHREALAHDVAAARTARRRRSARPAARRPPPPCGPRGRGPAPRARRPRSRSAGRARCRSSARASPCRRRRARGTGASRRARRRRSSET